MGLIGWADAPNSIEPDQTTSEPRIMPQSAPIEAAQVEVAEVIEGVDDSAEETPDEANYIEVFTEDPLQAEYRSESDIDDCTLESSAENDLLYAIRNLRLTGNTDENRYDISKFELHEIKFLFDHAERRERIDYFSTVREVFGVKHRILNEKIDIDSIESPNLDELMTFVEEKYKKSFGDDLS